uniref:Uncharacterized protein n=1 Tax=Salarias fasciatus TaxID=181472 RepID=A0A672IUY7_SALFA
MQEHRGSKDFGEFNTSLVWMEAKDTCDPDSLKNKSLPCLGKMLSVLSRYISEVERVSSFQSCMAFGSEAKPESHTSEEESKPIANWEKEPLCHYIMDRLFSFSILVARVFAVGDPTLHSSSATKSCLITAEWSHTQR